MTAYCPALSVTSVPGLSAPLNAEGVGVEPVTWIAKALAVFVPPSSLMTCLITISVAARSLFVIVQVFVSPFPTTMSAQSVYDVAYPSTAGSVTL